ncbi:MAG: carboxypeptidase-like regulatory domain-containing protein [bacterium]|nr:carboxypeptidase-like regulatory domain-containing protein [bacterium]
MSMVDSVHRWKELSHAFLLVTLLVAVVSVTGSVFTLAFFARRFEATTAQGLGNEPVGEEDSGLIVILITEPPPPPPPPPPPGSRFGEPLSAGEEPLSATSSPGGGFVAPPPPPPGSSPSPTPSPTLPPPASRVSPPPFGGAPFPRFSPGLRVITPVATPPVAVTSPSVVPVSGRGSRAVTTVALTAVAVATPMTAATALAAAASVPGGGFALSSSFLPFLAWVRPRRRPWGRVVEERTNLPVAGAVVTILDASGRTKESVSSGNDGTFAVLLPRGTYQLSVQHPRFAFAAAPAGITLFPEEQLYRGGSLDVKGEEGMAPLTPLVIGVKPTQPRRVPFRERLRSRFERLRVVQAQLAIPVTLTGAAINSLALWLHPTPLLVSYEILYGVFLTFELLLSRVARRTLGRVRDAVAKSPVGLAVVRLLDTKTKRLVATRVTTPRGSFLLMPPPGNYRLQVSHAAYAPYTSEPLRIGRGGTSAVHLKVDLVPGETPGTRAI